METPLRPCLHFVGFEYPWKPKDERYVRAVNLFGRPDFIHRRWDTRAQREIADCDTIIFAKGDESQEPSPYCFDDSAVM